jgi:hypothetical protein
MQEISARDGRRISLLMAALVGLVVGTGAWELIELRNTLRGDVLQANRVVAQIVARGLAAESDAVLTEERVVDLLDELELQGGGPVHVFDGRASRLRRWVRSHGKSRRSWPMVWTDGADRADSNIRMRATLASRCSSRCPTIEGWSWSTALRPPPRRAFSISA